MVISSTVYPNLSRIPKNTNKNYKPYIKKIIFINIDSRKIKFISLDSSHQDNSNESKMIKIKSNH
jgi:hypothetical protein